MAFPRTDDATRAFFETVVPDMPGVQLKPMFGNLGGFVNGNIFIGVLGADVFARSSGDERVELMAARGGGGRHRPTGC